MEVKVDRNGTVDIEGTDKDGTVMDRQKWQSDRIHIDGAEKRECDGSR